MLIEVRLSPPLLRIQVGPWHLRTWPSFFMRVPRGYIEPFHVYLVELGDEAGEACFGQAGAFLNEREAQRLVARLKADGRFARINMVPVHRRWQDYEFDR